MNLEFNIAVHLLTFLVKHSNERYSSGELSQRICVNPVQLRRVTRKLNDQQYVNSARGKHGGYQANKETSQINLSDLYILFNEERTEGRIFTGDVGSNCEISKKIGQTMTKYYKKEHDILINYYKKITISDVLNEVLKEDFHETI